MNIKTRSIRIGRKKLILIGAMIFFVTTLVPIVPVAFAQSEGGFWAEAKNVSLSGTASDPVIVVQPGGRLSIYWWDAIDGVTVAYQTEEGWSDPLPVPIYLPEEEPEGEATPTPAVEESPPEPTLIGSMPHIVGGGGWVHAFWIGELDPVSGGYPLYYSRQRSESTFWSEPGILAESATALDASADSEGNVHLTYIRDLDTTSFPSGVYYRSSVDFGASWGWRAIALTTSRYYRAPSADLAHIRVRANQDGYVYAAWNEPPMMEATLVGSGDGGQTWTEPVRLGEALQGAVRHPMEAEIIPLSDADSLVLWEEPQIGRRELYAAQAENVLSGGFGLEELVLEDLATDTEQVRLLPLGNRKALMVVQSEYYQLDLAVWDGSDWTWLQRLSLSDPDALGRDFFMRELEVAMVQAVSSQGEQASAQRLIAVGVDERDDVWVWTSKQDALDRLPVGSGDRGESAIVPSSSIGTDEASEPSPINLSQSGSASSPAITLGKDGSLRVYWQDELRGLTVVEGDALAWTEWSQSSTVDSLPPEWSNPKSVPILLEGDGTTEDVTLVSKTPRILQDAFGDAHGFWIQESDLLSGAGSLMYSRLGSGRSNWSDTQLLEDGVASFDARIDSGSLHVAYVCSEPSAGVEIGVYYRRSDDGGRTWSTRHRIYNSLYYHSMSQNNTNIHLAVGERGDIYATWNDPHFGNALLARSADSGKSWEGPVLIDDVEASTRNAQLIFLQQELWVLWQDISSSNECIFYQTRAQDLLGDVAGAKQRVLDDLTTCPQIRKAFSLSEDHALWIGVEGSVLTVAIWNGTRWLEPRSFSFSFEDRRTGTAVALTFLQMAVVPMDALSGDGGEALVVVGTSQNDDVWIVPSLVDQLDVSDTSFPSWSQAAPFSQNQGIPALPALATAPGGGLHAVWAEQTPFGYPGSVLYYARADESDWTRPYPVLRSSDDGMTEPAIAIEGERLHLLWSGGPNGQVFYSRAFSEDAYRAEAWEEPRAMPVTGTLASGSWPDIAIDSEGNLHVVYAVPLNEGRGIYYARSSDSGASWSTVEQVFDAAIAGWSMVDYPRLAIDSLGNIHVVWTKLDSFYQSIHQGVYYACSQDGGDTWSDHFAVAEGMYGWPQVVATKEGRVHLVWTETDGAARWWHRWLDDVTLVADETDASVWTLSEQVPSFQGVKGPVDLVGNSGIVQIAGLREGDLDEGVIAYAAWSNGRWYIVESSRANAQYVLPGVAVAFSGATDRLIVAFRAGIEANQDLSQTQLWYTERMVSNADLVLPPTPELPSDTISPDADTENAEEDDEDRVDEIEASPTRVLDMGNSPPLVGTSLTTNEVTPLLLGGGLVASMLILTVGIRAWRMSRR